MYSIARISCSETDLALGSASRDERFQYVSLRFNHPLRAYFVSPEQDPIGNVCAWNASVKATLYYDSSDIIFVILILILFVYSTWFGWILQRYLSHDVCTTR